MARRPEISVVLCTRDRRAELLTTLDTLARQRTSASWEVVVVDNGSRDESAAAVRQRASDFPAPLRCVAEPEIGLSAARNRGLRVAAADVVLFLDDDASCRPGWLDAHARAFRDATVVGSGGRIHPVFPDDAPEWLRASITRRIGGPTSYYDLGDRPFSLGADRPLPFGANMGLRRKAALRLGGFRTDLGWGRSMVPGEETELFRRLARLGRVAYVPAAIVEHRIARERCDFAYFERWHRGYGRSLVRLDPPGRFDVRARRAARASRRWAKWWVRSSWRELRRDPDGRAEALRKRAMAEGSLLELLGL